MQTSALFDAVLSRLNHRHAATSPSTNSELMQALQSGKLNTSKPHLLTAQTQTAGRGQHGRTWQSPKGNVYLSLYHPLVHLQDTPLSGLLSLIVGYQLATMPIINTINNERIKKNLPKIGVKWANDVGFYAPYGVNKTATAPTFNKLAGILIEPVNQAGKLLGVVVGVGMNLHTAPKLDAKTLEGMNYHAVALADLVDLAGSVVSDLTISDSAISDSANHNPYHHKTPTLNECYAQIAQAVLIALERYQVLMASHLVNGLTTEGLKKNNSIIKDGLITEKCDTLTKFMADFNGVDVLLNQRICVSLPPSMTTKPPPMPLVGMGAGINAQGCLQLRQDDATLTPLFAGKIERL